MFLNSQLILLSSQTDSTQSWQFEKKKSALPSCNVRKRKTRNSHNALRIMMWNELICSMFSLLRSFFAQFAAFLTSSDRSIHNHARAILMDLADGGRWSNLNIQWHPAKLHHRWAAFTNSLVRIRLAHTWKLHFSRRWRLWHLEVRSRFLPPHSCNCLCFVNVVEFSCYLSYLL